MSEQPGQVECYRCGELFTPDPATVQAWAESDRDWEPTDWECPACLDAEDADLDQREDWWWPILEAEDDENGA